MRIISWNCNMAFRKKYRAMLKLDPDLLIIQECENKKRLLAEAHDLKASDIIWHGNNPNKGIAIISFGETKIKLNDWFDPQHEYIIPVEVIQKGIKTQLFAV